MMQMFGKSVWYNFFALNLSWRCNLCFRMCRGCPMCCRFGSRIDALLKNTFIFNTAKLFTTANDDYEQQLTTKTETTDT